MRGLGRIFKRGSVYWIAYSYRGKEFRESSHSKSEAQAQRLLKKRIGEMGRGRLIGPALEKTTFDDLAELLLTDYRINRKRSLARITADRANEILLRATRSSFRSMCASALKVDAPIKPPQGGPCPCLPRLVCSRAGRIRGGSKAAKKIVETRRAESKEEGSGT